MQFKAGDLVKVEWSDNSGKHSSPAIVLKWSPRPLDRRGWLNVYLIAKCRICYTHSSKAKHYEV